MYQWATGSLLNNVSLSFDETTFTPVDSVVDIGMNFITMPEITQSGCDVNFTYTLAEQLFN